MRFIYCEEVKLDTDLALKLLPLADKYILKDLSNKCLNVLAHSLTIDNIYSTLDFAREEDILSLKNWCMTFLKENMNKANMYGLVKYLDQEHQPEFTKDNLN